MFCAAARSEKAESEWYCSAIAADCGLSHACEPRGMWSSECFTARLHVDAPKFET